MKERSTAALKAGAAQPANRRQSGGTLERNRKSARTDQDAGDDFAE